VTLKVDPDTVLPYDGRLVLIVVLLVAADAFPEVAFRHQRRRAITPSRPARGRPATAFLEAGCTVGNDDSGGAG
jgi:hypothetical protein